MFILWQINFDFVTPLIWSFLDLRSLAIFDMAITNKAQRSVWIGSLYSISGKILDDWRHGISSLQWLAVRKLKPQRINTVRLRSNRQEPLEVSDAILLNLTEGHTLTSLRLSGDIDDAGLCTVLPRCPGLESIELVSMRILTDNCLLALAQECCHIRSITLKNCKLMSDVGLSALGLRCAQLKYLDLQGDTGITDAGISQIAHGCPILECLSMTSCHLVRDAGLAAIAQQCCQLLTLKLWNIRNVTDTGISAIANGCNKLQHITILDCDRVVEMGFIALAQGCPDLQTIKFDKISLPGAMAVGYGFPKLKEIIIRDTEATTDAFLSAIGHTCRLLQSAEFYMGEQATDDGIKALTQGCPLLQTVFMSQCISLSGDNGNLTDVCISALADNCPALSSLRLSNIRGVTDRGMSALALGCPLLQSVSIDGCSVTDEGLSSLTLFGGCCSLRSLRSICLSNLHGVTDRGIATLAQNCPKLRAIDLNLRGVTDASISPLALRCPDLQIVQLCRFTDAGILPLSRCRQLKILQLSSTRVTPSGLKILLKKCPQLESLKVYDSDLGYNLENHLETTHPLFIDIQKNIRAAAPAVPCKEKLRKCACLVGNVVTCFVPSLICMCIWLRNDYLYGD
jgi:F-box and leucine-rich repeat protein 2/20